MHINSSFRPKSSGIFIFIAAFFLFLLFAEIILCITSHFFFFSFLYNEGYLDKSPPPFSYQYGFQLDSRGFKRGESEKSTDSIFKIVALGDSFTFATVPYPQSYLTLLENKLQLKHSPPLHILNLGIPGVGPADYLSVLVHEGLQYQPELVLLTLFIGDDILQSPPQPWHKKLHVSRLYSYIRKHLKNHPGEPAGTKLGKYCDTCPVFEEGAFLNLMVQRSSLYQTDSKLLQNNITPTSTIIEEIKSICSKNNILFAVVIVPDVFQVDTKLQAQVAKVSGITESRWSFQKPNEMIADSLDAMNIPYLDLLPIFTKKKMPLYLPQDVHWNIAGNTLAATHVSKFIAPLL